MYGNGGASLALHDHSLHHRTLDRDIRCGPFDISKIRARAAVVVPGFQRLQKRRWCIFLSFYHHPTTEMIGFVKMRIIRCTERQ